MEDSVNDLYYDDAVANDIYGIYAEYLTRLDIFAYIAIVTSLGSSIGASLFLLWPTVLNTLALFALLFGSIFILKNMYEELEVAYSTTSELEMTSPAAIVVGIGLVITALVYPHVAYLSEVHRGILTRETYPREEYSCCCSRP